MKPFHLRYTQLLAVSSGLLLLGATLVGCHSKPPREESISPTLPSNVVQLSPEAERSAAIQTVTASSRSSQEVIETPAILRPNDNLVFHINSFVAGRVLQAPAQLGDKVHTGQTMAVIENLDVARIQGNYIHELHNNEIEIALARSRYLLAQKNLNREKRLLDQGISSKQEFQQAETDATLAKTDLAGKEEHRIHIQSEARALLKAYGVSLTPANSEIINTQSPVRAPKHGIVIEKNVRQDDMIAPETVLYQVADLSKLWMDLTLYPSDFSKVHKGQTIYFQTDSLPGKRFMATIDYIQPTLNPSTNTYTARAFVDNPGLALKPGFIGTARIEGKLRSSHTFVPATALQHYGREYFVFIPLPNHQFLKQTVSNPKPLDTGYLVDGIVSGTRIVSQGAFTLKAKMLQTGSEEGQDE